MHTIEARAYRSEYAKSEHLALFVDGEPLDRVLHRRHPHDHYLGLVPTLLDWLADPDERRLVRATILPDDPGVAIAPVLMCPDDVDLWCTVIVAEVHRDGDTVAWRRFGQATGDDPSAALGRSVEWLPGPGFVFDAAAYLRCVQAFTRDA